MTSTLGSTPHNAYMMLRDVTFGLHINRHRYFRETIFSAPRSGNRDVVRAMRYASLKAPRASTPTMSLTTGGFETTASNFFAQRHSMHDLSMPKAHMKGRSRTSDVPDSGCPSRLTPGSSPEE